MSSTLDIYIKYSGPWSHDAIGVNVIFQVPLGCLRDLLRLESEPQLWAFALMFRLRSLFSSKPIARRVTLPPELYTCIFYFFLNCPALCLLCTVSQAFRHLAEPFLYRSVDLSYNHRNIRAWFERIGSNPHLAKFVRSVTFGIVFSQMPTPAVPLLKIIAHGLNSLVNLKEYVPLFHSPLSLNGKLD